MPRWIYADGTSRNVSQEQYDRLQDEAEAAWYEVFALAKWLAWCDWVAEFGENNQAFPFRPTDRIIFAEAERLMN